MTRLSLKILSLCVLAFSFWACDSGSDASGEPIEVPGADGGGAGGAGGAGGQPGVTVAGLTFIGFDETPLQVGEGMQLRVEARYSDGTERDVTAEATWTTTDAAVATVSAGAVAAVAPGQATIQVELENASASIDLVVEAPVVLEEITVTPANPRLNLGDEEQFKATARYSDGTTEDVTDQAEWAVDDVRVLELDDAAPGFAAVAAGGPVTVSARLGEVAGEVSTTVRCGDYPRYADVVRYRGIMPPVGWESAFNKEGVEMPFSLDDFRCFADYADKETLLVIFGAGWCPACTLYTRLVDRQAERLARAGMEVLHICMQTADLGAASSAYANGHITRIIGSGHGIRVGDRDSFIEGERDANYLTELDFLRVFPTVLVLRKSDMSIIADSRDKRRYLPIEEIALDPNGDWSNPDATPVVSRCAEGDEEATEEDNNFFAGAPELGAGTMEGGICNGDADYFRINVAGRWRATLTFQHATGDLAMYLWDNRTSQPLTNARGEIIGSDTLTDTETFTHEGPATLLIEGFMRRQTAPYTLTIEAL
jgi:hypothetical protein